MSNENVAIPLGLKRQLHEIQETRVILNRYAKGREMYKEALEAGDHSKCAKILQTFDKVLETGFVQIERTLILQEYLATGKVVVIPRDGSKAYELENPEENNEMISLSPYELQSLQGLVEVFGKDAVNFIEFDRLK